MFKRETQARHFGIINTHGIDKTVGKVDKQKKRGPWTNFRGTRRDQRGEEETARREHKESVMFQK